MKLLLKAINFATAKHEGQFRRNSGDPYITHPLLVSYLVAKYKGHSKNLEELLCAALLHDTIEDTNTTYEELLKEFTPLVAQLVLELTSDDECIKQIGKNEHLKAKCVKISSYGLTMKLIDRLSNVSDGPRENYLRDTIDLVLHIQNNRKTNKTQIRIINDILEVCIFKLERI